MLEVYACAIILVLLFPLVMWRDYLKGKSYVRCYLFCLLTQNCFLINLVLLLGFLNICNRNTLLAGLLLEYVVVRWTFSDRLFFRRWKERIHLLRQVIRHQQTYAYLRGSIRGWIRGQLWKVHGWKLWRDIRRHWFLCFFLGAVLVYNAAFLTHQVRLYHSYQFSDLPVHLSWVYGLEEGTLFVDGIYPFGMHAMLYCLWEIFGLPLRETILYYGSFQTLMTILCLYLFARKLFSWKYTPCLVLVLFSILLNQGRYAASLPQECGLFAMFSMGYFLLEILEKRREKHLVKGDSRARGFFRINQYLSRQYLDYPVWMLTLCVALVIEFHFYTAIAAIVLAFSIAVAWCGRFFRKQYFVPIVTAAIIGAMIAIVPFVACFWKGIPFQESMAWAMSVVQGEKWEGSGYDYLASITEEEEEPQDSVTESDEETEEDSEGTESLFQRGLSLKELIQQYLVGIGDYSNAFLLGWTITRMVACAAVIASAAVVCFLAFRTLRWVSANYMAALLYSVILITMGCAKMFGFVVVYEPTRASVFLEPFYFLVLAIPVDVFLTVLCKVLPAKVQRILPAVSYLICAGAGLFLVKNGLLHNYFDANQAYYNEPDYLIGQIKKQYDSFTYTIVSPTDEYYAVITDGYHTELSELMSMIDGKEDPFKIPTPYVFFFIEKYTLQDYFKGQAFVDYETAYETFTYRASDQDYYYQRNVLESKAYYWAERFAQIYPNQMQVYYEDDIYIAYVLKQDENSPLDLQIDYLGED
jgi:hypothetical protein